MHFDATHLAAAAATLAASLRRMPRPRAVSKQIQGVDFLQQPCQSMGPQELLIEQQKAGYVKMRPLREHLPAYQMADEICQAVREHQVTLVLGATGCGKTTQIPQFLLEDCASRGETCRVVATQPRRISAVSVADRVAVERGGQLGDTVAFKIRFEDRPLCQKHCIASARFHDISKQLTELNKKNENEQLEWQIDRNLRPRCIVSCSTT